MAPHEPPVTERRLKPQRGPDPFDVGEQVGGGVGPAARPAGSLRPAPRWSGTMTRQRAGSNRAGQPRRAPRAGATMEHQHQHPSGRPYSATNSRWPPAAGSQRVRKASAGAKGVVIGRF